MQKMPGGASADDRVNVAENVQYAKQRAAMNQGGETVALTDSAPLREQLARTGATNAEAYEWHVTKLPADQVVPAKRVRDVSMALFLEAQESRANPARAGWTDAQHRDSIVERSEEYKKLSQTHPRLVLLVTGSEVTPRKLQHLLELLELRERHEKGTLSTDQQKAQVSQYFMSNFVRPALPGEEEEAVRTGKGLRGTVVTKEEMEREAGARQ
jgi:hypothetical protein